MTEYDVLIVGAGPTGLACAIECQKRGLETVIIEKGCLTNSIYNYPTHMVFFTTPELLEIGDIPMTSLGEKPTRAEALKYYRRVAQHYRLDIRQYERVEAISGHDRQFEITTTDRLGCLRRYPARQVVSASAARAPIGSTGSRASATIAWPVAVVLRRSPSSGKTTPRAGISVIDRPLWRPPSPPVEGPYLGQ